MLYNSSGNYFDFRGFKILIFYQLRSFRQWTFNLSTFEDYFGLKPHTTIINIIIEPNSINLIYKLILNRYLDLESVRWDYLISEDGWEHGICSYIEFQQRLHNLTQNAVKRRNNDPAQESRVLQHSKIGLPMPRNQASFYLKLSKKISKS